MTATVTRRTFLTTGAASAGVLLPGVGAYARRHPTQRIFGGAHVVAPQSTSFWIEDGPRFAPSSARSSAILPAGTRSTASGSTWPAAATAAT